MPVSFDFFVFNLILHYLLSFYTHTDTHTYTQHTPTHTYTSPKFTKCMYKRTTTTTKKTRSNKKDSCIKENYIKLYYEIFVNDNNRYICNSNASIEHYTNVCVFLYS